MRLPTAPLVGHTLAAIALSGMLVACGQAPRTDPPSGPASRAPGSAPLASAAPAAATLPATPSVTIRPEPSEEVGLTMAEPALVIWPRRHSYLGTVQIVQAMENTSSAWIEVHALDSEYEFFDGVWTRDHFTYAYPRFVAPGETAYLIAFESLSGEANFSPRTHVSYEALAQAPSALLAVRNDSVHAYRDDRLRVTGEVTNVGTVDITHGRAAAVFLDGEGNIIGTADDGSLADIRVGETKAFTIATDIPLDLSTVADVVVVAAVN